MFTAKCGKCGLRILKESFNRCSLCNKYFCDLHLYTIKNEKGLYCSECLTDEVTCDYCKSSFKSKELKVEDYINPLINWRDAKSSDFIAGIECKYCGHIITSNLIKTKRKDK